MKTRFDHRFQETPESFSQGEWVLNTSIDRHIEDIKEFIKNEYEDFVARQWFYCSATAPYTDIICEWESLEKFMETCYAGDIVEIWILMEHPRYYKLKCPNKDGLFPKKGAY